LVALLLDKCADPLQKVILIPDGDDVVAAIDNNKDRLKEHFLFPHIAKEPSSMEYWMEKTHQKQLAKEIGLNVTNATIVEIKDGQYTIPSDLQYPVFPKPLATMNGGKDGMRCCNNFKELTKVFEHFINNKNNNNIKVLVEDFKEIDTEYALLGFSDGEKVIIPAILEFLTVSKYFPGIALQGKVMPVYGFEELIEKFKQLVLEIGFVGVFDIDFFKSKNVLYFCELNLRYGGSGYAITKMGVNLPAMMVKHFYGENIENMAKSISGSAVYVNDRMCMNDWSNRYISLSEYKRYIKSSDIRFVPDNEDTMPEKVYNKIYRNNLIKSILGHLIGK
jgi:biotin carboxylase